VWAFAIDHSCAVHEQEAVGAREFVLLLGLHWLCVAGSRQRLLRGALGFVVVIFIVITRRNPVFQDGVEVGFDIVFVVVIVVVVTGGPARCSDIVVVVVLVLLVVSEFVVAEFVARERVTVLVEVVVIKFVLVEFLVEFVFIDGVVVRHSSPGIRGVAADHRHFTAARHARTPQIGCDGRHDIGRIMPDPGPLAADDHREHAQFAGRSCRLTSARRSASRRPRSGSPEWSTKDMAAATARWPATSAIAVCIR